MANGKRHPLRGGIYSPNGDLVIDPTDRRPRGKQPLKVPMVPNIKLMNQADDGVVILMLGEELPMIGTALTANEARHLAMSLMTHAEALPKLTTEEPEPDEEEHRG